MAQLRTRRRFLTETLLGGAAVTMGCAKPQQQRLEDGRNTGGTPRVLGVALLGLGEYSESELAPALTRTTHCALRGIVTGSPEKIPEWRRKYDIPSTNVYSYETLPSIAENPAIDVVYVVTPTALHLKYAVMAAEAGKHVWCEKPMAMNVEECKRMIDVCKERGVRLAIGYRMLHEPNMQAIMELGHTKPYGAIKTIHAQVGDQAGEEHTWRKVKEMGGGALYDLGVYCINAIRKASGEEPTRVLSARQWSERAAFRDVDETTEFTLQLPSGAQAYGKCSRGESFNELRIECERGWYKLAPMQSYSGIQGETSDGKQLDQKVEDQQAKQMDEDALAILQQRPMIAPGEEGLRDVRIINAVQQCAATGQPVTI